MTVFQRTLNSTITWSVAWSIYPEHSISLSTRVVRPRLTTAVAQHNVGDAFSFLFRCREALASVGGTLPAIVHCPPKLLDFFPGVACLQPRVSLSLSHGVFVVAPPVKSPSAVPPHHAVPVLHLGQPIVLLYRTAPTALPRASRRIAGGADASRRVHLPAQGARGASVRRGARGADPALRVTVG